MNPAPPLFETTPGRIICKYAKSIVHYNPTNPDKNERIAAYEKAQRLEQNAISPLEQQLGRAITLREYLNGGVKAVEDRSKSAIIASQTAQVKRS